MTEIDETTTDIEVADLAPIDDVDHRFAGELLDPWRGYEVYESVKTAVEVAAAHPGQAIIAFSTPVDRRLPNDWAGEFRHQRRAGLAYVVEQVPHLRVTFRTQTVPFRGVGPDVRVFYVVVGPEEKTADVS